MPKPKQVRSITGDLILIPEPHRKAVLLLCRKLPLSEVNWALTGSTSFALQGVPIDVNDIDVQTDKRGAYRIEKRLSEFTVRKVKFSSTDRIRSHFGALMIEGVEVEIMGAVQKKMAGEKWEDPIEVSRLREFVELKDNKVPVLNLEYEYRAALRLGRPEKAALLKSYIENRRGRR